MAQLTDDEAITLALLHGAEYHQSSDWCFWKGDEGSRPWVDMAKPTAGDAARDYCRRHGLGAHS